MSWYQFPSFGPRAPRWRVATWWPSDSRRSIQKSLLQLLATAHSEKIDVAPLAANFAQEHRGRYGRRLKRFATRLGQGTSLVDALEQTPDVLSDDDVLAIRFATQTGTIAAAYQQLTQQRDAAIDRAQASWRITVTYAIVMLVLMVAAFSFLLVFIVPTLKQISEEMGVQTPFAFGLFVGSSEFMANYAPLLTLAVLGMGWLVWSTPSRRFFRRYFGAHWIRGIAQERSAQLLELLALTAESGRPVSSALSTLARYHFDRAFRQKLLYVRNEVEQGADVWETLSRARLTTNEESNALASSSSNLTRAWAMRRLADWKLENVKRRRESATALLRPAVVLAFAGVILVTALAFVGYLAHLTRLLA